MLTAFRSTMVLASALSVLSAAAPASAGGSVIHLDGSFFAVGESVVARGAFGPGSYEGGIADGPYVAYLVPAGRSIEPGPIPSYAILLGNLAIRRGNVYRWVATLRFVVPDVSRGQYAIDYCNDPCSVDGVGDLIGSGWFWISDTRAEARMAARRAVLQRRASRVADLREELAAAEARTDALESERESLLRRVTALAARVEGLRSRIARPSPSADLPNVAVPVTLVVALVLLVSIAIVRRRSRHNGTRPMAPRELVELLDEPQEPYRLHEPTLRP